MNYRSFPDALVSKAREHPDKIFLIEGERQITFRQHLAAALSFAEYLRSLGIKKGDNVVILTSQTIACLNSFMALHIIGAVVVPLEGGSTPAERILEVCEMVTASVIIGKYAIEKYQFADISLADIDERYEYDIPFDDLPDFPEPDDVLSIVFTTGTTGKSKGVVLTVDSQISAAENLRARVYQPDDVVLIPLPLNLTFGIRRYQGTLFTGCTLVLCNIPLMASSFYTAIPKNKVNVISITPSHLSLMLNFGESEFAAIGNQLRLIDFSSSTISKTLKEKLIELLPRTRLISIYGMTEANLIALWDLREEVGQKGYCLGKLVTPGVMYIGDSDGRPLGAGPDNIGHIYLSGRSIMKEYHNEPELTSSVLKDGLLKTADMGYYDEDGFFYTVGRADDVIVAGALKIAPQEIEDAAMQMADVEDCACVPVADSFLGSVPKLFVVMREGAEFSFKAIYDHLSACLERTSLPRYIEQIEHIPRTENGKLLRRNLKNI